jgi:hypothetical protein
MITVELLYRTWTAGKGENTLQPTEKLDRYCSVSFPIAVGLAAYMKKTKFDLALITER